MDSSREVMAFGGRAWGGLEQVKRRVVDVVVEDRGKGLWWIRMIVVLLV